MLKNLDRKINLAFVLCSLSYGGAERFTLDLINNLNRDLFNIHLLTVKDGGELWPDFNSLGIKLNLYDKKTKLGLLTLWRIKNYFKQNQIDIVHTQLFAGDTWGRIAARLAGVPIIISTEQNINLDEKKFKKFVKRILSKITTQHIAISRAVAEYQIKAEKIRIKKIQIIPNGIELGRFPYLNNTAINQPVTLGIIGRLELQKGHLVALKALAAVVKKYPETKLLIIGQGSQKKQLQETCQQLGLINNIIWQRPQTEVMPLLQKIDILLMPSLWEGLGIVALEALAVGVPIIASDIHGLKEIITDQQTGFLVPANRPPQLAAKIVELIENPDKIAKIKPPGRARVETAFDIKKIAFDYQKIYLKHYENSLNK